MNEKAFMKKINCDFREILFQIEKEKNNMTKFEKFFDLLRCCIEHKIHDDRIKDYVCDDYVSDIMARSYYYKNDKLLSLVNNFVRENDLNITKYQLCDAFWRVDCYENTKKIQDEHVYYGLFEWNNNYYKYYDKYNYLFENESSICKYLHKV